MSLGDWGAVEGVQRAASYGPIQLTNPVSLNTKGAWTQFVASTPFDAAGLVLGGGISVANAATLIDIGVGASGSEQVVLPNYPARRINASNVAHQPVHFHVAIPAGSRIALRYQSSVMSPTMLPYLMLLAAGWNTPLVGSRIAAYGAVAASSIGTVVDPGAAANTKGAWVELAAAADFDASWLVLSVLPAGTILASASWVVDVAIGPSGAEQIILPDVAIATHSTTDPHFRLALPISIPAGSRVAVRAQCSSATTPGREREFVVHLIG